MKSERLVGRIERCFEGANMLRGKGGLTNHDQPFRFLDAVRIRLWIS